MATTKRQLRARHMFRARVALAALAAAFVAPALAASAPAAGASVPVLGGDPGGDTKGFGRPHPSQIIYGGNAITFNLAQVRWTHWGAKQALATAKGWYVPPGKAISQGHTVTVKVVAYRLGTCNAKRAYTLMAQYVPSLGQHLHLNAKNDVLFCNTGR